MDPEQQRMFPQSLMERLSGEDFQFALAAVLNASRGLASAVFTNNGIMDALGASLTQAGGITGLLCQLASITCAGSFFAPKRRAPTRMEAAAALRKGLVDILRSFLENGSEEFDVEAIESSIRELTENRSPDAVADMLRPLYIKASGILTEQRLRTVAENLYGLMKPHLKLRMPKKRPVASGKPAYRGPKTKAMDRQLKDFIDFVSANRYTKGGLKPRGTYELANAFWNRNRKAFDANAEADGEKRGYGNYRVLANAYINLPASRPQPRPLP